MSYGDRRDGRIVAAGLATASSRRRFHGNDTRLHSPVRIGRRVRGGTPRQGAVQHLTLTQKLQGHDAYYGITGKYRALSRLRQVVRRVWRKWLARRRAGPFVWDTFSHLEQRYPLSRARVVHSVYALLPLFTSTSRMPESGTSGSVGALGGDFQGDPATSCVPFVPRNRHVRGLYRLD